QKTRRSGFNDAERLDNEAKPAAQRLPCSMSIAERLSKTRQVTHNLFLTRLGVRIWVQHGKDEISVLFQFPAHIHQSGIGSPIDLRLLRGKGVGWQLEVNMHDTRIVSCPRLRIRSITAKGRR